MTRQDDAEVDEGSDNEQCVRNMTNYFEAQPEWIRQMVLQLIQYMDVSDRNDASQKRIIDNIEKAIEEAGKGRHVKRKARKEREEQDVHDYEYTRFR